METTTPTSIAPGIIYALGTIAVWAAFFFILKVANALGAIIAKTPDSDPSRTRVRWAQPFITIPRMLEGLTATGAMATNDDSRGLPSNGEPATGSGRLPLPLAVPLPVLSTSALALLAAAALATGIDWAGGRRSPPPPPPPR